MRIRSRLLALLVVVAAVGPSAAQEEGGGTGAAALDEAAYADLVRRTIDGHVRPAFEDYARRTDRLADAVDDLCRARDGAALDAARAAFRPAAEGTYGLLPVRFGPMLQENRQERLAFWPDPRGIGLRQVQALLAGKDPAALDPATLAGKSVAVQGLTALEVLLHGTGADALATPGAAGDYRCAYAEAIAANVAAIASDLVDAWAPDGEGTRLLTEPGPGNPMFLTHREAAGEIFGAAASGLEVVAGSMIVAVFGSGPEEAKPKLAPFWRSGASLDAAAAGLAATRHMIEASGAPDVLPPSEAWLAGSTRFMLERAEAALAGVDLPLERAVSDPAARDAAGYAAVTVESLEGAVGRDLTAALGLEQGFNASDGD